MPDPLDKAVEAAAFALFTQNYTPSRYRPAIAREHWPQVSEGVREAHRARARPIVEVALREVEEALLHEFRMAATALGVCATAFYKMDQGTEQTPLHCRQGDAERAEKRAREAGGER